MWIEDPVNMNNSDRPGLGVRLNHAAVQKYAAD